MGNKMSDGLLESVSNAVHEAWMAAKRAQGVESRCSESGEELMVPYADLSDAAQELDRATVRGVLEALSSGGYRVVAANGEEGHAIYGALVNADCYCEPGDPTCEDWLNKEARWQAQVKAVVQALELDDVERPAVWPDRPDVFWCVRCDGWHRKDFDHSWAAS